MIETTFGGVRGGGPAEGENLRLTSADPFLQAQLNSLVDILLPAGLVDSNWCVGAVLEKKMPPLPVTLALGAFLNHWRNRSHCGFSITVG